MVIVDMPAFPEQKFVPEPLQLLKYRDIMQELPLRKQPWKGTRRCFPAIIFFKSSRKLIRQD
ncbi:MAG: hypothetical protein WBA66_04715 [Xanthobacteraceae bacterium]